LMHECIECTTLYVSLRRSTEARREQSGGSARGNQDLCEKLTARQPSSDPRRAAHLYIAMPEPDILNCRIEGVAVAHIYPRTGILTHALSALRMTVMEPIPSFW